MFAYVLMTEDAEILSVSLDKETAMHKAKIYAQDCGAKIGEPKKTKNVMQNTEQAWRVPCYPNNEGFGFLFDVLIEQYPLHYNSETLPSLLKPQAN